MDTEGDLMDLDVEDRQVADHIRQSWNLLRHSLVGRPLITNVPVQGPAETLLDEPVGNVGFGELPFAP
jgi:hypothetical protein